jgi:hypothetical protein
MWYGFAIFIGIALYGGKMDEKLAQIITMGIEAFASVIMTYFLIQRNIRKNSERFDKIDKRLDKQYQFIRGAVVNSGIAVGWANQAPFPEVVRAIVLNLWLHENGNTRDRLVDVVAGMKNGVSLFNSILNDFMQEHRNEPNEKFWADIKYVQDRVDERVIK